MADSDRPGALPGSAAGLSVAPLLRFVVIIGPTGSGLGSIAAALSMRDRAGALPAGVHYPTGAEWFGRHSDEVTTHAQLIDLAGGESRVATPQEPLESRQSVRDRVNRIAEDCRRQRSRSTVVFCAPGAAWRASAPGLRRELRAIADEVLVVILARRAEFALASTVADAVRRVDETGETALSARGAMADPSRSGEHDYAALLERWTDPTDVVPVAVVPYPEEPRGASDLVDRVADRGGFGPLPPWPGAGKLRFPSLTRADLVELVRIHRLSRRFGWVPTVGTRMDARFGEVRRAADERAHDGAEPFRFSESEQRWLTRRTRGSREALAAALGADAEHPEWSAWFDRS